MRRLLYVNAMTTKPAGEVCRAGIHAAAQRNGFEVIDYNLFYGDKKSPINFGAAAKKFQVDGVILSGSEKNTTDHDDPWLDSYYAGLLDVLSFDPAQARWAGPEFPIFGICFGHQALACVLGGDTERFKLRCDLVPVKKAGPSPDPGHPERKLIVYHGDHVTKLPRDFTVTHTSDYCQIQGMQHEKFPIFSLQSHPEMNETMKDATGEKAAWAHLSRERLSEHDGDAVLDNVLKWFMEKRIVTR